jgi:succinate dehydrogenase hydrophobic anchor subunit
MMSFSELKKFLIFSFIGSLIVAALVAVVTVLFGQFNEVTGRVFFTLFMVVLHSLVSLAFIWDDSRRNTFDKLAFFINTVFILIVLSFVTSLFGIWKIVSMETIWHTYQTYFLIGFASLHADILSKASRKEKYMDAIIYANYIFIVAVVLIFIPIIFITDAPRVLGEMYFRILAAVGIIDGTLSVLTIIFYKLYMHKHPEIENPSQKRGLSIWILILIIYLLFQVLGPVFWVFGSTFWR